MARHQGLRRDRRLVAGFGSVAAVCLGFLGTHLAADSPPPAVVSRIVDAGPDGALDLTFGGDTMLGDGAQPLIDAEGYDAPLAGVRPMLGGDVTIVNAEAPITSVTTLPDPGAKYSYAMAPPSAAALARAGVDVLGLGNNHAMDRGAPGLAETQQAASSVGLSTFGAGVDRAAALRPLLLRSSRDSVAILSFGEDFGPLDRSTDTAPGMVPLSVDRIQRGIMAARRAGASRVIAYVHWGDNYADVNAQQRYWAGLLVDAGYDAVLGHGPHVLQPVEVIRGTPVVFSLGNLAFGAPGRFASYGKVGVGAVARLRWDDAGRGSLVLSCVQTDNTLDGYVARACPAAALAAAHRILGPAVSWTQNQAGTSF